ncbi:MAG: ABC transporter ATP-binding protein [Chthoniobacterales bacterium]
MAELLVEKTAPAIKIDRVTKTFPVPFTRQAIVAVRDLSLQVEPGQIYGLLGPNGSGKSTTLKIILGLVAPTRGKSEIFGHDSRTVGSREAVGFLPESPYFYNYLTGAETLAFFGKLSRLRGPTLRTKIDETLALVGLSEARHRRLSGYSKGMLQRIGLAQALIHDPKLVILDEPTASVDPAGTRDIHRILLNLKRRGVTVLLSSHLLSQVQEICDRVGILAQGALVREGAVEELLALEDRTEVVLRDASPELLREIGALAQKSGAEVVEERKSRTTLERLFLDATENLASEKRRTSTAERPTSNGEPPRRDPS